ncbi:hypothetical protein BGW80DRAFT_1306591 [Lactifluus volemus]|nr:hypothetical protein BGW80DRAFT_1306591 [Lactifluus volemus]
MLSEVCGVNSLAHIKHRLEASYWNHWSLYPAVFESRILQPLVYDELIGMLSHGCMDVLTSNLSSVPYDSEKLLKMIKLVQKARETNGGVVYFTAATTRLLSFFAHWRFLYFHGQRHARLVRDETVYDEPVHERTVLITLASPLLFFVPGGYLRDLERLWTDEVLIETVWETFVTKLLREWQDVVLWSVMMLVANVGFLAIPGVVITNLSEAAITSPRQLIISTSPAQIASSLSIQASIGSVVTSLLLLRHHRQKQKEDLASVGSYLTQSTRIGRCFGLEPLAIVFSLPWALLMWSVVTFFISLLLFCFYNSNMSTRIVVAVSSVLMTPPVIVCIVISWRTSDDGAPQHNRFTVLKCSFARLWQHIAYPITLLNARPPLEQGLGLHTFVSKSIRFDSRLSCIYV